MVRGWTGRTGCYSIQILQLEGERCAPPHLDFLQAPEEAFDSPLNLGQDHGRWYVVYRGIYPGIYRTQYVISSILSLHELTDNSEW